MAPPRTERDLLARADALAGATLAGVAFRAGVAVPPDLRRAKGFVGRLVEHALGATAASRDEPDFPDLGIELKTIPVGARGRPLESTFVCHITLTEMASDTWEGSRVWRKLSRVLWVPVEGERSIAVGARRIGAACLWEPSAEQVSRLRADWEELAGIIGRGDAESIDARIGECLQVRPKAASARSRRAAIDADGAVYAALPRGFYLRASFTAEVLRGHYAIGRSSQ